MPRFALDCLMLALAATALSASLAVADDARSVSPALVDKVIAQSFTKASPEWRARFEQDETQKVCTTTRNQPSPEAAAAIRDRERSTIAYPADGQLTGDWRKGEALAQNGYGGRFTDKDKSKANGGNCYACHQLAESEIAYGTLGPSLAGYGRIHRFDPAATKLVYDKIYNSQALQACSLMPRFGTVKFLSIDDIKNLVAYVVSPDSPVNR
jgi:sulfur-oxidizing protein SoxX